MPVQRGAVIIADGDLPALLACAAADRQGPCVAWVAGPTNRERSDAARGQAELYGLDVMTEDGFPQGDDAWRHTLLLLHACRAASIRGLTEVVWPVHAGSQVNLDAISAAVDKSLLVSRLAALSVPGSSEIEVRTPYVDFTDDHIADLAIDMDLPVRTCWWWEPRTEAARSARSRWGGALARAGWSDLAAEIPAGSGIDARPGTPSRGGR